MREILEKEVWEEERRECSMGEGEKDNVERTRQSRDDRNALKKLICSLELL